jgi:thioesterase domain-containing protein
MNDTATQDTTTAASPDHVAAAVRAAWNAALGTRASDPNRSIADMRVGAGRVTRLLNDIEATTGVALPITIVFQAPTCDALTAIVQSGVIPPPDPVVVIKPGDGGTPLFIVPGVGATVFELFDVGRGIDCPGAVLALQPRGPDGFPPNRTIPAQARYLADCIRARHPQGPYRLLGYSYGGLVALECARLLRAEGGVVEFLGLLDTTVPEPYWSTRVRLEFLAKRLKMHALDMRRQGFAGGLRHAAGHVPQLIGRIRRMFRAGEDNIAASPFHIDGLPPALGAVRDANIGAFNAYELKFYDGVVTLFHSAEGDPLSCDPVKIWPHWTEGVVLRAVPGSHETMMRGRHGIVLSASISEALRQIDERK